MNPIDHLRGFVTAGRAAADAASAIAGFATSLQAFGCEEYFSRMLAVARARSMSSTRPVEWFLGEMSGAMARGDDPDDVLKRYQPTDPETPKEGS